MLNFRLLHPESLDDVTNLQQVLEGAPQYSLLVNGHLPLESDAVEMFKQLPPGKSFDDKIVGGFWLKNQIIGCVDICKGYPENSIAFIGLLLFKEEYQRCGYGRKALAIIRSMASSWNCCSIRIAVIENNVIAIKFWNSEGFTALYRKTVSGYIGDAIIMESLTQPVVPADSQRAGRP